MWQKKSLLVLFLIIVLATVFRLYRLDEFPSFHADEADFANNGYSILKTSRDQEGNFLPLGTTSVGDLRPAFYAYLSAFSIKLFGFNELATRLPTTIFSLLTIVLLFFITLEIFKDKKMALLSSFLLAVSFWHITLSREASEKIVALFLVTCGIFWLYRYLHTLKIRYILMALVLFFISIHTYYAPRFFLLVFLPIIHFFLKKSFFSKKGFFVATLFSVFCLLTIFFTFFYSTSSERIKQLSIFNNPSTIALLGEQIREDGSTGNVLLTRFFHNKPLAFTLTTVKNYLSYFSPQFLFLDGGFPNRVKVPAVGLMNYFEFPFLLIGVYLLMKRLLEERMPELKILFCWILISIFPAALTFDEVPNIYRTILILPPLIMIIAYGMVKSFSFFSKNKLFIIIMPIFIFGYGWSFAYFLHQYFVHYEIHQPWSRNYAQKILALTIQKNYSQAKIVFVPELYGGVEQMFRFYLQFNPAQYQKERLLTDKSHQRFRNIQFTPEICPYPRLLQNGQYKNSPDYIFVNAPECRIKWLDENYLLIDEVKWKDGNPAYDIIKGI